MGQLVFNALVTLWCEQRGLVSFVYFKRGLSFNGLQSTEPLRWICPLDTRDV